MVNPASNSICHLVSPCYIPVPFKDAIRVQRVNSVWSGHCPEMEMETLRMKMKINMQSAIIKQLVESEIEGRDGFGGGKCDD